MTFWGSARWWRYLRGLAPPAILFALTLGILFYALETRARGEMEFEENALKEWILETRVGQSTLPELVRQYLQATGDSKKELLDAVQTHLAVLGDLTRSNEGLLPLFPYLYRMELHLDFAELPPIVWDSNLPLPRGIQPVRIPLDVGHGQTAELVMQLQLRAFANRQEEIALKQASFRHGLSLIAVAAAGVALLWITLFLRRERTLELREYQAREQLDALERQRLQEQLLREEEELKRREAEKQVLEARTKLYADISVLAGSYAHNIKNLLVRPNDLIQRCLEDHVPAEVERRMLAEARESLRHVAERTQQILRTVRRDLQPPEPQPLELNQLILNLGKQWRELALHQWKVDLEIEPAQAPVWVQGDASHLQQALENLLCNARDATFEQRNQLRVLARKQEPNSDQRRQTALLAASAWHGRITVRVSCLGSKAVLSVHDNGIGMSEVVLARCTEAHFSTKRDNAMLEGQATGMGLGLSFVAWVVEQHEGKLEIASIPEKGTTVSMLLPAFQQLQSSSANGQPGEKSFQSAQD